jgi:hypothetical protein
LIIWEADVDCIAISVNDLMRRIAKSEFAQGSYLTKVGLLPVPMKM